VDPANPLSLTKSWAGTLSESGENLRQSNFVLAGKLGVGESEKKWKGNANAIRRLPRITEELGGKREVDGANNVLMPGLEDEKATNDYHLQLRKCVGH